MPPKTKLATTSEGVVGEGSDAPKLKTEDLVEALLDPRVLEALMKALTPFKTSIETTLDKKLESFGATLRSIKAENGVLADKCKALSAENVELKKQIEACSQRVEECERYSRSDNLIFRGLPERSSAEVASAAPSLQDGSTLRESHTSVEETVSAFIKDTLHVDVLPSDISTAHRIKGGAKDTVRPIIVRLASRRVRNLVFGAKKISRRHLLVCTYRNTLRRRILSCSSRRVDFFARRKSSLPGPRMASSMYATHRTQQPGRPSFETVQT